VLELSDELGLRSVRLDMCAYGEEWKKSTRLLCSTEAFAPLGRLCSGLHENCRLSGNCWDPVEQRWRAQLDIGLAPDK
jgi:hypothetical protein